MLTFILGSLFLIFMTLGKDWLIYKHRGSAQPDDPEDENSPVVTGPEDAGAQRYMDLFCKDDSDKKP